MACQDFVQTEQNGHQSSNFLPSACIMIRHPDTHYALYYWHDYQRQAHNACNTTLLA